MSSYRPPLLEVVPAAAPREDRRRHHSYPAILHNSTRVGTDASQLAHTPAGRPASPDGQPASFTPAALSTGRARPLSAAHTRGGPQEGRLLNVLRTTVNYRTGRVGTKGRMPGDELRPVCAHQRERRSSPTKRATFVPQHIPTAPVAGLATACVPHNGRLSERGIQPGTWRMRRSFGSSIEGPASTKP
jgi:hypothetical protein